MIEFDAFLEQQAIQLTTTQKYICDLLLNEATKNEAVRSFLFLQGTGKTMVFQLLETFCSSVKVFDLDGLAPANPYWLASEHSSAWGAD